MTTTEVFINNRVGPKWAAKFDRAGPSSPKPCPPNRGQDFSLSGAGFEKTVPIE